MQAIELPLAVTTLLCNRTVHPLCPNISTNTARTETVKPAQRIFTATRVSVEGLPHVGNVETTDEKRVYAPFLSLRPCALGIRSWQKFEGQNFGKNSMLLERRRPRWYSFRAALVWLRCRASRKPERPGSREKMIAKSIRANVSTFNANAATEQRHTIR